MSKHWSPDRKVVPIRWASSEAYSPAGRAGTGGPLKLLAGAVAVGIAAGAVWTWIERPAATAAPARSAIVLPDFGPNAADAEWENRGEGQNSPSSRPVRTEGVRVSFGTCHSGGGTHCVVDGDTLWLGGQKIRVADIDAPETHEPRCAGEQALGDRATQRLQELLNGGAVSLQTIDRNEDRFGRKLRIVLVDGRSVGETLVDEGLARRYAGGRQPWC